MATDEGDSGAKPELEGETTTPAESGGVSPTRVAVGEYTWDDFLREHGYDDAADRLYERFEAPPGSDRWGEQDEQDTTLRPEDWERAGVDPATFLGFPPWELDRRFAASADVGESFVEFSPLIGYDETPVIKDIYGWEDYKREYFYDDDGEAPTDGDGEPETFDPSDALGFDPDRIDEALSAGDGVASDLADLVDERTVDVDDAVDEDAFFSDADGTTTLATRYDLEKAVPQLKKSHFVEEDRYWVNEPHAFVIIFHSTKENEKKYYVVEPHLNEVEEELTTFLTDKLRTAIKYDDEGVAAAEADHRGTVIEERTLELLDRYDLYDVDGGSDGGGLGNRLAAKLGIDPDDDGMGAQLVHALGYETPTSETELSGSAVRPEPAVVDEDHKTLSDYQVEKLLYYLERDFIGYELIDGIKHDINVEDVSCDGYDSPVFVYHSDYEQIISNVYHGRDELDDFVVKLAQRSGKGISKRRPQVDATLPDGSRAQLTLGTEVSDHGTNYTIRQFKDVPFTPVDLINWRTFSLEEMAYLWLCIENHKSILFAGGTASGKTTSLNAVSLFIPSNGKIVSIEDTREVELPQRNWIASVTRPSFSDDDKGDIDEFELLEAALRQRPDYIVMGEVRGEEGRTLFQVMSTGHTTYTTFHADNVGEVLKRFTTEPINVSKTMFTALDLVSIQTATRVKGRTVRRNKSLTEINHYDAEDDEINVQDVFQWQAETDEFLRMGDSNTLEEVKFDRGWDQQRLEDELFKRQAVLAYLIDRGLNTYTQVAATLQAFINDPESIVSLMANDELERSLEDLREMESVQITVDPEDEEMVPRPDPTDDIRAMCREILERAEDRLFADHRGKPTGSVADALADAADPAPDVDPTDPAGKLPEEFAADATGDDQQPDADGVATEDDPLPGAAEPDALDEGTDRDELDDGEDDVPELVGDTEDLDRLPDGPSEPVAGDGGAGVDGPEADASDGPDTGADGFDDAFEVADTDGGDDETDASGSDRSDDGADDGSSDDDDAIDEDEWGFGELEDGE
ncbi:MAG: type II/IV secretion system ATPase subunit [Halolamina sp.]